MASMWGASRRWYMATAWSVGREEMEVESVCTKAMNRAESWKPAMNPDSCMSVSTCEASTAKQGDSYSRQI